MITRPGSRPGPPWLRRLSDGMAGEPAAVDPGAAARRRRWQVWFWVGWGVFLLLGSGLNASIPRGPVTPYRSAIRIAGIPLVAYGNQARGIIAVGGVAVGVIAIGGVAIGAVAFGGVAAGGLALGGVSAGVLALGGLALGAWALGGVAVGYYAGGGLAVGGYAYAGGGVAVGYHEASGRQRERLFPTR